MLESGAIVELSNNKKYMISDYTIEDNKIFYIALEVDYQTEIPKNISVFFEHAGDSLIPVVEENDIKFLQTIFYDKFIEELKSED